MSMHGLLIELDTKSIAEDGTFSGYAATFGNVDQGGDIILPGAFAKSLLARPATRVKMLRQHDQSEPIGVWTSLVEDRKGLKAEGRIIVDTVKGRETHLLMKAGALDGMSIGYRVKRARFDRAKNARLIEEVELAEVSIVTFPMNPKATVTAVKNHDPDRARRLVGAMTRAALALRG